MLLKKEQEMVEKMLEHHLFWSLQQAGNYLVFHWDDGVWCPPDDSPSFRDVVHVQYMHNNIVAGCDHFAVDFEGRVFEVQRAAPCVLGRIA